MTSELQEALCDRLTKTHTIWHSCDILLGSFVVARLGVILSFFLERRLYRVHKSLIFWLLLLSFLSLVVLYSASYSATQSWFSKQIVRLVLGWSSFFLAALTSVRWWWHWSYVLYGLSLALLVGVELLGFVGMGAKRWIHLGVIQLQPSEFIKVTVILALARYFHTLPPTFASWRQQLFVPLILILLPILLILKQPDLGTAIILGLVSLTIFWQAGVSLWFFSLGFSVFCLSCPVLWCFLRDYQKQRILSFLDPQCDPLNSGYHVLQSQIALGSGGLTGKGFLQGTQSHLGFVPEKQTDFIFALWCEEWGFRGACILVTLYILLMTTCLRITYRAQTLFHRLVAVGMTSLIFFHTFINIAMVTGLCPVVGIPLPFLSYGGTALLSLMLACGCLMMVHVFHNEHIS